MLNDPAYRQFEKDFIAKNPGMKDLLEAAGVHSMSQLDPGKIYVLNSSDGTKTLRIIDGSEGRVTPQYTGLVNVSGESSLNYYLFLFSLQGTSTTNGSCIGLPISIPQVSASAYVYGPASTSRTAYGSYSVSANVAISRPPTGGYSLSGYHTNNSCSGSFAYVYTYDSAYVY